MTERKKSVVLQRHHADENNDVITVQGGGAGYKRRPCVQCPWLKSNTGSFPAEAFRISANTADDMSTHEFGCHMSTVDAPVTCAGYLLNGSEHNLATRLKQAHGRVDLRKVSDGGHELHHDYVAMAVANGVDEDDEALAHCRRRA